MEDGGNPLVETGARRVWQEARSSGMRGFDFRGADSVENDRLQRFDIVR